MTIYIILYTQRYESGSIIGKHQYSTVAEAQKAAHNYDGLDVESVRYMDRYSIYEIGVSKVEPEPLFHYKRIPNDPGELGLL
jgi:hypothetical protein